MLLSKSAQTYLRNAIYENPTFAKILNRAFERNKARRTT